MTTGTGSCHFGISIMSLESKVRSLNDMLDAMGELHKHFTSVVRGYSEPSLRIYVSVMKPTVFDYQLYWREAESGPFDDWIQFLEHAINEALYDHVNSAISEHSEAEDYHLHLSADVNISDHLGFDDPLWGLERRHAAILAELQRDWLDY
eukprot:m.2097 g.2097  ORF g.2097 m.2097 type:complete len:150 (-) comp3011_c0_seq1:192-641(-)